MLIAVSKIILAAERTFPVFVKAMVNGLSVDGAAADGDVFRRNTGQLLCVQVVIDIVCAPLFPKPEGVHRAVQDLDPDLRSYCRARFSRCREYSSVLDPQIAALCGHGAVFNDDIYPAATERSYAAPMAGPNVKYDERTPDCSQCGYGSHDRIEDLQTVADGRVAAEDVISIWLS